MDKIFAPIKGRIVFFIEKQGIKRGDFFANTDISPSNFKGKGSESEIGGDKIAKILTIYPAINPVWLLTGQGEMLSTHQVPSGPKDSSMDENRMLLQEKDARIAALEKIISSQDRTIELLEEKIAVLSAPPVVPVVDTAAAG